MYGQSYSPYPPVNGINVLDALDLPLHLVQHIDDIIDEEAEYVEREERFRRMSEEGMQPMVLVMSAIYGGDCFRALEVIGERNNWRLLAYALAGLFHCLDPDELRVIKARGFDRLRNLVAQCVNHLRRDDSGVPGNYPALVQRLFSDKGYYEP